MQKENPKTKKIFYGFIILAVALFFAACSTGSTETMTAKEFKTKMEEKNIEVVDQTDSTDDISYLTIYVAADPDKYKLQYYVMRDSDSAKDVYKYAAESINAAYENDPSAVIVETGVGTVARYSQSADDYCNYVYLNDNTVLWVTTFSQYKDEAGELIEYLGY